MLKILEDKSYKSLKKINNSYDWNKIMKLLEQFSLISFEIEGFSDWGKVSNAYHLTISTLATLDIKNVINKYNKFVDLYNQNKPI